MAAAAAAPKQLIEKVTARVFCHSSGGGGGNPVTIFAAPLPSRRQRERLAQTCDWESVFVGAVVPLDICGNNMSFRPPPQMAFHMPTGEQVSFCAHAAMGGSTLLLPSSLSKDNNRHGGGGRLCFATAPMPDEEEEELCNNDPSSVYHATIDSTSRNNMMVSLEMEEVPWTEEPLTIGDEAQVRSMLRKFHDVVMPALEDDPAVGANEQQPSFCNSSVARDKTLVRVEDVAELHEARAPTAPDQYRDACDAIDSTGLYLYAGHPTEEGAWECRQFPRASGYPEDPATGIAAAALACSLRHHHQETLHSIYKFYQGSAMGQPSLIVVENLELRNVVSGGDCANGKGDRAASGTASFCLEGKVEVDERETIEINDEDMDPQ